MNTLKTTTKKKTLFSHYLLLLLWYSVWVCVFVFFALATASTLFVSMCVCACAACFCFDIVFHLYLKISQLYLSFRMRTCTMYSIWTLSSELKLRTVHIFAFKCCCFAHQVDSPAQFWSALHSAALLCYKFHTFFYRFRSIHCLLRKSIGLDAFCSASSQFKVKWIFHSKWIIVKLISWTRDSLFDADFWLRLLCNLHNIHILFIQTMHENRTICKIFSLKIPFSKCKLYFSGCVFPYLFR